MLLPADLFGITMLQRLVMQNWMQGEAVLGPGGHQRVSAGE